MSNTIEVLSADSMKNQYWGQYKTLATLLNETLGVLRALKAEGVPADVPTEAVKAIPAPNPPPELFPVAQRVEDAPQPKSPLKSTTLSGLVREGAATMKRGITAPGILAYIREVDPSREVKMSSLSALISQISREEDWSLDESGIGGQPNVYSLKQG